MLRLKIQLDTHETILDLEGAKYFSVTDLETIDQIMQSYQQSGHDVLFLEPLAAHHQSVLLWGKDLDFSSLSQLEAHNGGILAEFEASNYEITLIGLANTSTESEIFTLP